VRPDFRLPIMPSLHDMLTWLTASAQLDKMRAKTGIAFVD
jgi:hypothetical protein